MIAATSRFAFRRQSLALPHRPLPTLLRTYATKPPTVPKASPPKATKASSDGPLAQSAAAPIAPAATIPETTVTTPEQPTADSNALPTSSPFPTTSAADAAATPESEASSESLTKSTSLAQQFLDLSDPAAAEDAYANTRTGAKAKGSGSKSSIEKRRQNLSRTMVLLGLGSILVTAYTVGREWDDEFEKLRLVGRTQDLQAVEESEMGGYMGWLGRGKLRTEDLLDYLNKPAWEPLIPPPLPEPHYRPYTLVVDLDDLLVHSSWDIDHGWRTAKRPGVDYFLAYLSQFYEIVLFTTQPAYTAAPIVEKIDPYGAYIPWKLYRESTRYKNKTLIKDLSYMGRPLERTIILDTDASHFQLQPTNGILLTPWKGSKGDATSKELVSLIPFLEALAIKGVKDVRPVIKYYEGKHIPTAYAEAEAKAKKELLDKWEKDKEAKSGVAGWIALALGSLISSPSRDVPPETDVEKVRKNAQRMYLEEQKYWKDNEESIKKSMDDDRERQLKEMKSSLLGYVGLAQPKIPE